MLLTFIKQILSKLKAELFNFQNVNILLEISLIKLSHLTEGPDHTLVHRKINRNPFPRDFNLNIS